MSHPIFFSFYVGRKEKNFRVRQLGILKTKRDEPLKQQQVLNYTKKTRRAYDYN